MIGFLGAYTTFSTWMLESWRLVEGGSYAAAVANIVVSVAAGGLASLPGSSSAGRSGLDGGARGV